MAFVTVFRRPETVADESTRLVLALAKGGVRLEKARITREGITVHLRDLEGGRRIAVGRGPDLPAAIEDGYCAVQNRRRVLPMATLVALDGLMRRQ